MAPTFVIPSEKLLGAIDDVGKYPEEESPFPEKNPEKTLVFLEKNGWTKLMVSTGEFSGLVFKWVLGERMILSPQIAELLQIGIGYAEVYLE